METRDFINQNFDLFIFFLLICCKKITDFFKECASTIQSSLFLKTSQLLMVRQDPQRSKTFKNFLLHTQTLSFSDSVLNVVGRLLHLPEEAALVLRSHELSLVPDFSSLLNDVTLDLSNVDMPSTPSLAISRRLRSYAEKVVALGSVGGNTVPRGGISPYTP